MQQTYRGGVLAVDEVELQVARGEIYGLPGLNFATERRP
jgi:ABC-type branched-subunit amino acid transport system ATPase component